MRLLELTKHRRKLQLLEVFNDGERVILKSATSDSTVEQMNCSVAFLQGELDNGRMQEINQTWR